ncbi:MAG: choice-of-anchor D domain-containing protein [Actinobacteria bacterium]|nr:choice-of-anchor D domain-containing protein [Actinomycetota bacterium]
MRSALRILFVLTCALGLAVGLGKSVASAASTPNGPVQPGTAPFTGVTYTAAGDIGSGTGLTWTFSGLTGQLAQYQSLEWGATDPNAVELAMNGDNTFSTSGQVLAFDAGASDLAGGKAVWTGNTPYPIAQPAGTINLETRLTLTATDTATNSPITGFKATSGYGDGATVPVTGDFSATMLFEVSDDNGATWTPATDYFNAHQNVTYTPPAQGEYSSFNAGFFYLLNSHLSLSPTSMDFGSVQVGQQSAPMTLTFTNSGTAPTDLTGATFGGADPGDFALTNSLTCPGNNPPYVPPSGSCSVSIVFTPAAAGARSATLTIKNDSPDGPQTLTLSGNGTNPGISVAPATLTFSSQAIGTTSSAQPAVVTSNGTSPLNVGSVTISGPFQISSDGCSGQSITPPGTCTIQVVFTPTATGTATGTLTIPSDGGTKTVTLSGTGAAVADLGISIGASPNPISTGKKAFLTYAVTLSNAGPNVATGIVITDPLPSFSQFQSLTPPPGGTCTTPAVGASGTVVCTLSTLNAGGKVQLQIVVAVVAPKKGTITNTVSVTSQSVDPQPANNQASASTVVK